MPGSERKENYFKKLIAHTKHYSRILIVEADNVGSHHMQSIRLSLRGQAELLMGKNTLMRKAIRDHIADNPKLENLLPHLRGNIGLLFTNDDLAQIKTKIIENRVAAPAKAGATAANDVIVPAGDTGLEPTQTAFLQALNIASRINRGQVQILNDVHLLKAGDKIGPSEATLLAKLGIKPFKYGLKLLQVYDDGAVYDPAVLDLSDADIILKFQEGVAHIAALSLELGYPTVASVPHSLVNGFKSLLAIALETGITFEAIEKVKKAMSSGPSTSSAPSTTTTAAKGGKAEQEKPKETKPVKQEEPEEEVVVSDLFGGGGDDEW